MKRRGGFTLVELTITITISAIVLGVMTMLFGFASVRLSDTYTQSALYDQMNGVADRIESTIRNADTCSLKDVGATLVCGMPKNGVDTDGDGHNDTYYPDKTDANGVGQYTVHNYVWFYNAGTAGTYKVGSGNVWRAERAAAGDATAGDVDTSFGYYYGGQKRYPLVQSVSFAIDSTSQVVTFTITGSTRIGKEGSDNTSESATSRTVQITRSVAWRN